jgi:Arc/MetJ-type ribon-helix-helix transcriptional regulator
LIESFPPETIDFDPAGIPTEILDVLQEAIICHSVGAYRSASIMVRRALEELCKAQGAKGNNLKDRIAALGQKIVVPKDLLDATDELRILGNDAAHVEAKSYDAMDAQTSELAIEVAKELLKAVYQHVNLVAKLKALRKGP